MPIMQLIRGLSAAQFAGIVLLFFLPFVQVSCSNMIVIDISGQQFATGGSVTIPAMPNTQPVPGSQTMPNTTANPAAAQGNKQQDVKQQMSALIAWILAAAGIVISLIAGKAYRIGSAAVGGLGAVMMFWLKSEIDKEFGVQLVQAQGFIQLNYQFAFWACAVLFLTAAATNVYALLRPPNAAAQA